MRKILFVVNPVAGKSAANKLLEPFHTRLSRAGIEYEMIISPSKGQVEVIAADAVKRGLREIVGVGGDGTLTEIIQGVFSVNPSDVTVGIIPCGTGNDFAKMLYLDSDPMSALECIIEGTRKTTDIFDCNQIKCINVCAMGIDGQIVLDTEKIKKTIPGPAAYLISTIKSLLLFKARRVLIKLDGKISHKEILIIAVGNGQFVGGGMQITPKAKIDDGLMDVCIVNKVSKPKLLALFPSIFKGEHLKVQEVEYYQCREVEVESIDRTLLLNVDGNIVGTTPVRITLSKDKIQVFCES
jgi:YegS/Rv2252/BmrU family lipid kinase